MRPVSIHTLLTVIILATSTSARKVTNPSRVAKNAVLLSNVASLTLRANKLTTSRRVKPIPQLDCVGPNHVCGLYRVDVMRCKNEGGDYEAENIQWSCKASLPEEFKLGSTDVICEGYESSDDPYVLKGSCGVEYRLLLTEKGLQKYGANQHQNDENAWVSSRSNRSSKFGGFIFAIIFAAVLFVIVRGFYRAWRAGGRRPGRRNRPNGGDDNDPPPPYDGPPAYHRTQPRKKYTYSSASSASTSNTTASSSQTRAQQQQGSWRPGFWTGALTGAAAGYTASRLTGQQQTQGQNNSPRTFFGGNRSSSSASSSGNEPSYSTERHESTGFGGTRRR